LSIRLIVTSLHWETIAVKVGDGRKAKTKTESALGIEFSGAVAGAGDLAAYQLSSVTTKRLKRKTVTTYKPIRLISAMPASSPMALSVVLVPATKPNVAQTDRLEIVAADLTDALGLPIDGKDDGQPGGDFVATFGRTGVSGDAVELARSTVRRPGKTDVIDALLADDGMSDVRTRFYVRRVAMVAPQPGPRHT
jgi:hypothetical protein